MSHSNEQIENKPTENQEKVAGWMLNASNIGIFSASISIAITVLNKLMRMFGYNSLGLVILLYILAGIAGFLALICSIKNAKKFDGHLTIDAYLAGIAILTVVLV